MEEKSKELEEYLESALKAIKNGVEGSGDFRIKEPIVFDLAVMNTKEIGTGFKIYVLNVGGKIKAEQVSRIKIKIYPDRRKEAKVFLKASPKLKSWNYL